MSDDSTTTEPTEAPNPGAPVSEPTPSATGIESLPEWAQKELTRARADAAKYRTERNAIKGERDSLQGQLTEFSSVKDQMEALITEKSIVEFTAMRLEAALEAGLDKDLANRLQGENAEELAADAKALASRVRGRPVDPTQGRGGDIPLNGDPIEDALKNALGIR